ncbi:MAG: TerB N-terminal domain-containing protein, partial [Enterovibrio sp.]
MTITRSFSRYSFRLMELMACIRPEVVLFDEQDEQHYDSLLLRFQLATLVAKEEPIPAYIALAWLKNSQEYTLRTPARRCADEFASLFQQQYTAQFGDGMCVKPNKTRLTIHYYPASASLRDCTLEQPDLPDPYVLKAPIKKLIAIAEQCTESLSAYSRYICKKGASTDDIGAMLLLPDALFNVQSHLVLKKFKSWADEQVMGPSKGLVCFADLWSQIGTELPERINKKEIELILTLVAKGGFGIAPDPRHHHAKPAPNGKVVLFLGGSGAHFRPSQTFDQINLTIRLGAMVATVDNHVDSTESSMLHKLIDHDTYLSPFEKRSLHAYLHWCLNSPTNMAGIKEKVSTLSDAEKEAIRSTLVTVAIADDKVAIAEIKQLEKLYTALGLDKTQVTADIHQLKFASNKDDGTAPTQKQEFVLDEKLLALHASQTKSVQSLLGAIFVD